MRNQMLITLTSLEQKISAVKADLIKLNSQLEMLKEQQKTMDD